MALDPQTILSTLLQLSIPGYNRAIGSGDVVPYTGPQNQQSGVGGAGTATPGVSYDPTAAIAGQTSPVAAGGNSMLNNLSALTPFLNQIFQNQQDASIISGQGNMMANPLPGAMPGASSQSLGAQFGQFGLPIAGAGKGSVPSLVPSTGISAPSGDAGSDAGAAPGGESGTVGDGTAGGIGGIASGGEGGPGAPGGPGVGDGTAGGIGGDAPGGEGGGGGGTGAGPGAGVGDGTAGGIGGSAPGGEGGAPGNSGDGGGAGGAGGGSTVICTELHRQGLMSDETRRADELFGRSLPLEVMAGYRLWAAPLARRMAPSPRLTRVVASIALPWAQEMAYRMGASPRGSRVGRIVMVIGVPLCALLGHVTAHRVPSIKSA